MLTALAGLLVEGRSGSKSVGMLIFSQSVLLGALAGAVAGLIVSRPMVEQRRKYFYRDVITENLEDVNNLE